MGLACAPTLMSRPWAAQRLPRSERGRCDKSHGQAVISRLGHDLIHTELSSHGLKQFASHIYHCEASLIPFRFRPVLDGLEVVAKCR